MMATSHSSLRASPSISLAFFASPTRSMSDSAASICRNPWRTIGWSSAMSIFMAFIKASVLWASGIAANRHREGHRRALAGSTADVKIPAEKHRALAHAHETKPVRPVQLGLPHALSIVLDFQDDLVPFDLEIDAHPRRLGMAGDVGQHFLKDPEHRG